ncbi:hypothetical protein Taro_022460 [Colocasia esculenta]|uniref:Uncharacterized protein n=1 Tax=Colocasia esculenta TaxID=4460 RepID=A0A843VEI9_COLES|nr:hypothetical protein [Colocasia esculenta]
MYIDKGEVAHKTPHYPPPLSLDPFCLFGGGSISPPPLPSWALPSPCRRLSSSSFLRLLEEPAKLRASVYCANSSARSRVTSSWFAGGVCTRSAASSLVIFDICASAASARMRSWSLSLHVAWASPWNRSLSPCNSIACSVVPLSLLGSQHRPY